jgi:putative transposase
VGIGVDGPPGSFFEADKHFRPLPRPSRSAKRPFPEWADYTPNSIWIYDTTHFTRAKMAVLIIEDLVSRKWLTEIVSAEETSTQVELAFTAALDAEELLEAVEARLADGWVDLAVDDETRPILLAVSDNGPQMTSGSTREFLAMCAIAQHFGRPHTPTDQAWIESLSGHLKAEYPHLLQIRDPAILRAELAVVRHHYNTVRLHAGIGYVTPDDEHTGRGEAIQQGTRSRPRNRPPEQTCPAPSRARRSTHNGTPRCWVIKRRSATLSQKHVTVIPSVRYSTSGAW